MLGNKMKDKLLDISEEDFLHGAARLHDVNERVRRESEVADLKEVYSREYLLRIGLVIEKEYETIPASTSRKDSFERAQEVAKLRNQVVGAEVDY